MKYKINTQTTMEMTRTGERRGCSQHTGGFMWVLAALYGTSLNHCSNIKELFNLFIISSGNAQASFCAHKGPGAASKGTGTL